MARATSVLNHPNGSVVSVPAGSPEPVIIYTSQIITIPANTGIVLSGSFDVLDSTPGYIAGAIDVRNSDTNTSIGSAGSFAVYSSGTGNPSISIQNPSGTPLNIQLVVNAGAYFAATTAQVANFTTSTLELYPKEAIDMVTLPDNNVSTPDGGVVIFGDANTSTWYNIHTVNIPAGNIVTTIGIPLTMTYDDTSPIFSYEILVNGISVESYDQHMSETSTTTQFGVRYTVETTQESTLLVRVKCKTQGGSQSGISHRYAYVIRLDLDKIGSYSKFRYDSVTPITTNPMLQTAPLTTVAGHTIMSIMCYSTWAAGSIYRDVRYNGSGLDPKDLFTQSNISSGASLDFANRTPANTNLRGDFYYELFTQPASTTGVLSIANSSTWTNQTMRPGSAIYLFDLSAEVAPTEEYEPNYYLEIS